LDDIVIIAVTEVLSSPFSGSLCRHERGWGDSCFSEVQEQLLCLNFSAWQSEKVFARNNYYLNATRCQELTCMLNISKNLDNIRHLAPLDLQIKAPNIHDFL